MGELGAAGAGGQHGPARDWVLDDPGASPLSLFGSQNNAPTDDIAVESIAGLEAQFSANRTG